MAGIIRFALSLTAASIVALIMLAINGKIAAVDATLASVFISAVITPGVLATVYARQHHM